MSRERPLPPPEHDLDEPGDIAEMVRRFYQDVAQDDLLGPMFEDVARVDWAEHLPKLAAFWCRALLGQEGYAGNPFRAHAAVHARSPFTHEHFDRWLQLFHDTVELGWVGPRADRALALAEQVAEVHRRQFVGEVPPVAGDEGGDPPCWEGRVADRRDLPVVSARRPLDSRTQVHDLVTDFYREVVFDPVLAPVFDEAAEVDWARHIPNLIDYWCGILLGEEGRRRTTVRTHRRLHALTRIEPVHCDRWYELWVGCVDERWEGTRAELAKHHAASLMAGMARRVFGFDWRPAGRAVSSQ